MRQLNVYLYETHVGVLTEVRGAMRFQYQDDVPNHMFLSVSMPVRKEPYDNAACHAFFGGLLPEEGERDAISAALTISNQNDFSLLEVIGRDCAGAVSLFRADERPDFSGLHHVKDHKPAGRKINNADLYALFKKMETNPLLIDDFRFSLAGAQKKLALILHNKSFYIPAKNEVSTHIIKPPHPRYEYSCQNEYFCSELYRAMLTDDILEIAGPVDLVKISQDQEYSVFVIQRYDRITVIEHGTDTYLKRMHQEDFCQALGMGSELKYQSGGGPDYKECFSLLSKVSKIEAIDKLRLLRMIIFNYLIGNNDAHGKNFSFLYTDIGLAMIASAYDLLCTEVYFDPYKHRMAMKIGGYYEPYVIQARHWENFADDCKFSKSYVMKKLKEEAERIVAITPEVHKKIVANHGDSPIYAQIINVITKRANHILSYFE